MDRAHRFFSRISLISTLLAFLTLPQIALADLAFDLVSDRVGVVDIRHAGDGSGRLFLLEQGGRVWVLEDEQELDQPFLDLRDRISVGGERGLLSLAFAPDYAQSGRFYTWYTDRAGDTVLSRFLVSDDANRADRASEQILLTVAQPRSNHNGGRLQFGPDGYLYLGIGDGGGGGDPEEAGQDPQTLLGSLVRLDVSGDEAGYDIPPDNPFVGRSGRDEIWAIGLRNPWRMSFDRLTGDLFIADVGQNDYEEVNVQPFLDGGGQNYGWNEREGPQCFASATCLEEGLTDPISGYAHDQGCSITGGEVYRGEAYADLHGRYLFGDFCTGRIWGVARDGEGGWNTELLDETDLRILTFGEGEDGRLFVSGSGDGVFHLRETVPRSEPPFSVNAGLNDAWFNPATPGQGFFINVFPDSGQVFLAWFTFEVDDVVGASAVLGAPEHRWLTAIGDLQGGQARLTVSLTEGGLFDQALPAPVTEPAGEILLSFTSCDRGMVTYRLPGPERQGQIPIQRVVTDNLALCEALAGE